MEEDKFTWTQEYKKSWDDATAEAKTVDFTPINTYNPNRKNIIRHLLIAIDSSISIEKPDYLPTVRNQVTMLIPHLISCFIDMNPLSTISFMSCSDTFQKFSRTFDSSTFLNTIGMNDFSLLNCLKAIVEILKTSNYIRECLIITASIGTKDRTSLDNVLKVVKKLGIKINIISICGEVTIFKKICQITNGIFLVPLNLSHFEILLNSFAFPLESTEVTNSLIKFGFPELVDIKGVCVCHLKFHNSLYECPVCKSLVCCLPVQCPICSLQLVSSLSMAKSYHYMNPLELFEKSGGTCKICNNEAKCKCPKCCNNFCNSCSDFMHNDLCFCLGCE